jgi:hypothetical protein
MLIDATANSAIIVLRNILIPPEIFCPRLGQLLVVRSRSALPWTITVVLIIMLSNIYVDQGSCLSTYVAGLSGNARRRPAANTGPCQNSGLFCEGADGTCEN